ncbi:uncharacterized protein LOC111692524 [Anoplophora glabripennis]|uniref:uncharacterized protein LOC111692524 n=1 Tax=Anoplophora glabripennis TaxID=217634 RepID=UPI000C766A7C|nr:uncharacterized protein LOC111692524 [Anoplophora glabripennis]
MVQLETIIQNNFAKRNHTVAVFFDIVKAYDMVWKFNILRSIHNWDIRGNLAYFIKSFLENRSLRVRLGVSVSELRHVENGIPQGSTLSVVLFAIAINNLVSTLNPEIGRMLYVDDLVLFYSAKHMQDIERTLQKAINDILDISDKNGFRFSNSKTHCVHFCRLRSEHGNPQLSLGNQMLEFKNESKFLGIIFDSKLNWRSQIQNIATRCKKDLNILRCLSGIKWGSDKEVLLRIYKSLILTKMDYGCVVYASARKSQLKILDSVHHTGLRLALGAYRTSPGVSLCCEADIPPLIFRRNQLLLTYGITIWAQPNHPNHQFLFNCHFRAPYEQRLTITRPTGVRLYELLNAMDEIFPTVYSYGVCQIPPWILIKPKFHLECSLYKKGESNKKLLTNTFYSIINTYQDSIKLYTDGSKFDNGVGSAFFNGIDSYSWTLPKMASIYTAELYAIWQALRYAEMDKNNTVLICCDSLSAIEALSNSFTTDPLVQIILELVHWLCTIGKKVCFIWTPSHIGIQGNEIADCSAKEAAKNQLLDDVLIRSEDIKAYLKNSNLENWQEYWNSLNTKLKEVRPNVTKGIVTTSLTRREQTAIIRLRIGHTNLTHNHLLRGLPPPLCENCNVPLSAKHLLLDCPRFQNHRKECLLVDKLNICLGFPLSNLKKTIEFLKAINILHKI